MPTSTPRQENPAPAAHMRPLPPPQPIVPLVARARPEPARSPAAPPREETTIHVSIGRVEVRAVQPQAAPARREASRPAVMSLDEYLRSRSARR
jgi:hypothetical protein